MKYPVLILILIFLQRTSSAQTNSNVIPDKRIAEVITGNDYDSLLAYPQKVLKLNFILHHSYEIIAGPTCKDCLPYDTTKFNVLKYDDQRHPQDNALIALDGEYLLVLYSRQQVDDSFYKWYGLTPEPNRYIIEKK